MLSAVENHLGSGRVYPHPFPGSTVAGGPSTAALLGQLPLSAAVGLPLLAAAGGPNLVDMSVAEFARPHPKQQQRYGEAPRNGLHSMSARSKYSEPPQSPQQQQQHQNGPVNLAVSSNLPNHTQHGSSQSAGLSAAKLNQLSHEFHERSLQAQARAHAHAQQQHQQQHQQHRQHQEQQKESVTDLGKLYSPTNPRLAFFPSPLDANSYAGLNYGLYPFGYPAAHLDARMLGRPTYLPGQREPYNPPSFLTPGSYGSSESPKSKMYPSVSLSHLNGHSGLKPTSLPQLPQDKLLADERSPTMPLSPSSSTLMGAAASYAERERSSYLNGLTDHPMHSKYQAQHEKENKHEHKQHHSSHSQQQQLHPGSGSVSGGPSLHALHHFPPPLPATALPPSSSSSSSMSPSSNQRHHSMPHPSTHGHYHGQSLHGHSLSVDGLRLEPNPQENEFKVPSGKEGSLKHRILTRPASERDTRRRSPTTKSTPIFRPFENGSTTNFTKGALIQLADECKRVEDVRTEDFVQTAEKSADLRLAESTTVRITPRNNNVIITFSYDNNRSRVDIEAAIEHPFFVYGQGWASCSPEKSMQQFGLKCQRLQVGDICLSLLPRESKPKPVHSSSSQSSSAYLAPLPPAPGSSGGQYLPPPPPTASQQLHRHDINGNQTSLHHQQPYHHPHPMMEQSRTVASSRALEQLQHLPQNLSRKASHHHQPPLTIPTTATSTAVSSRLSGAPSYGNFPAGPIFSMPFSAANLSKPHDSPMQSHYSSKASADQQRPLASSSLGAAFSDQPVAMVVDKPVNSSTKSTNETRTANNAEDHRGNNDDDDCAIDVSMSRKRRWSAPDACDEADENQRPTQGSKVPQVGTS
uniref:Ataxin-1 n=1 Tax=Culex pipiens TaxID=7175 RepID=A0A8D8I9I5_CULPI